MIPCITQGLYHGFLDLLLLLLGLTYCGLFKALESYLKILIIDQKMPERH